MCWLFLKNKALFKPLNKISVIKSNIFCEHMPVIKNISTRRVMQSKPDDRKNYEMKRCYWVVWVKLSWFTIWSNQS